MPQPDSVEPPVLDLPVVELVAPVALPDGVLAGAADAAGAVLFNAGEPDGDEDEAEAAPDAPVVAADGCAGDEAEPEDAVELDDDEDGDE